MQRLKKCLGIDIGTTSVKISEVVAEKNGVRITRMLRGEVPLPPGPMDQARMDEIAKVVRQLISDNKITAKHAVFSVPGQNVFIRRIRFPRTNEERLHRIVAYEAKQQIPFPPENSLMEYQVFDYGDSAEVEVLLAAIKTDIITDFMRLVNKCGLKPAMISVTSLALFNFHVFDSTPFADMMDALKAMQAASSEPTAIDTKDAAEPGKKKSSFKLPKMTLGKKKKLDTDDVLDAAPDDDIEGATLEIDDLPPVDDMFEEVKAYINVGSQTFDLAIARHGKRKMLGFTRSVAWASGELTRMLTSQLGVDAAQADQIKKTEVTLPSSLDVSSEPANQASEIAVKWAEKMVLEIRKSFDFYIAQPDGMAVDNIILSGGGAELKGLTGFMEDRLGVPVELRPAPENPDIVITDPPEDVALTSYLVSFGLALSGLGFGHVNADFLPHDMKVIREFKKKKLELGIMAAIILAMIGLSTQIGTSEINNMRNWLGNNRDNLDQAARDASELSQARSERQAVAAEITAVGQALGDRAYWPEFLGTLEGMKPAGVAFDQLELQPDGTLRITGRAQSDGAYLALLKALRLHPDWVNPDSVRLEQAPQASANVSAGTTQQRFVIVAESGWKKTRLEPARVTLTPGHWTPTPAPTQDPNMMMMYGDPTMTGNPLI